MDLTWVSPQDGTSRCRKRSLTVGRVTKWQGTVFSLIFIVTAFFAGRWTGGAEVALPSEVKSGGSNSQERGRPRSTVDRSTNTSECYGVEFAVEAACQQLDFALVEEAVITCWAAGTLMISMMRFLVHGFGILHWYQHSATALCESSSLRHNFFRFQHHALSTRQISVHVYITCSQRENPFTCSLTQEQESNEDWHLSHGHHKSWDTGKKGNLW